MNKLYNKKGAVEMSLNLIIMLIIGLTVLGLVIGFVTNLIGDASNELGGKLSASEEAEQETVLKQPGRFAVFPSKVNIAPGDNRRVFLKIQNTDDAPLTVSSSSITTQTTNTPTVTTSDIISSITNNNLLTDSIKLTIASGIISGKTDDQIKQDLINSGVQSVLVNNPIVTNAIDEARNAFTTLSATNTNTPTTTTSGLTISLTDLVGNCASNAGPAAEAKAPEVTVSANDAQAMPVTIIVPQECANGDSFQVKAQLTIGTNTETKFINVDVVE